MANSRSTASSPRVVDLAIVPVVPGSGPEHTCERKWPVDTTEHDKTAAWPEGCLLTFTFAAVIGSWS